MANERLNPEEEKQMQALRLARKEDDSSLEPEEIEGEQPAPAENHTVIFVLAFLVAGFSDLADIFIIGAVPLVGDVLDAATGAILTALFLPLGGRQKTKRLMLVAGATIFEFLPFGITDIMPTFTLEVIYTWYLVNKENRSGEQ